jgi:hypothetical protein
MTNTNAFAGVGVVGMARTLLVAEAAATAAHPAFTAHAGAAAAIPTQRKRRTATAIVASVDRGIT